MSMGLKVLGALIFILFAVILVTGIMWVDQTDTATSNRILAGAAAGLIALLVIINRRSTNE